MHSMFGPALLARVFRTWRAIAARRVDTRARIAALRRRLCQQSCLWAWRRLPRVQGLEQGVAAVLRSLVGFAVRGEATDVAATHDARRTKRKFFGRWTHARDVRQSWFRRTFAHWLLLKGTLALERSSAIRIQCCWRRRTARFSMHKLFRLKKLADFKLVQAAREEEGRLASAKMLLGGLAARWRVSRLAKLSDIARLVRLQKLRDDQKEAELLREVLRQDHIKRIHARDKEKHLLYKIRRIQAWYRGILDRRGPIRRAVIQARLSALRERRAAKSIVFMFRLRKRRRDAYARRVQLAWLGFKGRRAARLRRRARRFNATYTSVARVSNKVALALGLHGYAARIGWLETLELIGLITSDGDATVENALAADQRDYWTMVKNREWTLKWQSKANQDHQLWMERHVTNPVRPLSELVQLV